MGVRWLDSTVLGMGGLETNRELIIEMKMFNQSKVNIAPY